jgi:hypothetical protein
VSEIPLLKTGKQPIEQPISALYELRRARRAHRLADIHWSDSLYRLYVVIVGGGLLLWWVVTLLGHPGISLSGRSDVIRYGPGVVGVVIALVLGGAYRSGSRGGPLSLEAADVTHVMQSPVSRSISMVRPYIHQLRRGLYIGAMAGLAIASCTRPFLGGSFPSWIAVGVAVGGLLGVAFTGLAAIASGHHVSRQVASLIALALLVWASVDVATGAITSPMALMGSSFFWPVSFRSELAISPIVGVVALLVLAVCVAVFGRISLEKTSLELVERRTALVGQLRFAVTTQDLRAALLLRRQLAAERPRLQPWFTVKGRAGSESAVRIRAIRGIARWPIGRILRGCINAIIAGVCARLAWEGTIPLAIVSGLAMYLVALDACEAMAQDVDHPDLSAMMPRHKGRLANRQTIVPFVVVGIFGLISGLTAFALGGIVNSRAPFDGATLAGCLALGILASVTATAGAALNLVIGPPPFMMMLQTPELAIGFTMISPIVALVGPVAGVLWTRSTFRSAAQLSAFPGLIRATMAAGAVTYMAVVGITSKGLGSTNR